MRNGSISFVIAAWLNMHRPWHQGGVDELLEEARLVCRELTDNCLIVETWSDIIVAEHCIGKDVTQSLRMAKDTASAETDPELRSFMWCVIALTEADTEKNPVKSMHVAKRVALQAGERSAVAMFFVALTEAQLSSFRRKALSDVRAQIHMLPQADQPRAFARLAMVQGREQYCWDAEKTVLEIRDPYERIRTHCELAVIDEQPGTVAARHLEEARKCVPLLQQQKERIVAICLVVAAAHLTGGETIRELFAIEDAAELLLDPVDFAFVSCQIAATKAQIGHIDGAKIRAARIHPSSYRDSALACIARQEARRGHFADARATTLLIESARLRERALKGIAHWLAKTASGASTDGGARSPSSLAGTGLEGA